MLINTVTVRWIFHSQKIWNISVCVLITNEQVWERLNVLFISTFLFVLSIVFEFFFQEFKMLLVCLVKQHCAIVLSFCFSISNKSFAIVTFLSESACGWCLVVLCIFAVFLSHWRQCNAWKQIGTSPPSLTNCTESFFFLKVSTLSTTLCMSDFLGQLTLCQSFLQEKKHVHVCCSTGCHWGRVAPTSF